MVIFHSYVSLPEGISIALRTLVNMRLVIITIYHRPREELELLELRCFTTYWMGMFPSWGRRPAWVPAKQQKNTIYLVGGLEHLDRFGFFSTYWECHHPNCLILQDGLKPPTSDWYPDLPFPETQGNNPQEQRDDSNMRSSNSETRTMVICEARENESRTIMALTYTRDHYR